MHHFDESSFSVAAISEEDGELLDGQLKSPFGSSFRTFDATDYSNIGQYLGDYT